MNKRFLLLIALALLLMASGPAYSQQAFRHSASRQTWRLPYTGYFPQKTNFGNDILEELARDLLKPPQFVNLAVNFTDEILLRSEQPSYWTAIVNFSDFRLSGYCQYRSFPMSDVLLPSGFRFALGAIPMVPVHAGPKSLRMSPNKLLATTTSKKSGRCTKCAVKMSI